MCIALISTEHPDYPLIIINNRDEYLRRPTAPASFWPSPNTHILGGRDLARAIHGTWMGVTKSGKIAVLTNYREQTTDAATGKQSRGAIVNNWLTRSPDQLTTSYVEEMVNSPTARDVGGFSLVCGYVGEPLAIVSNRSSALDQVSWIAEERGVTKGLSNTVFDDRSWPKILKGETLVGEAIGRSLEEKEGEERLIERLLEVLSTNSLPALDEGATAEDYLPYYRNSIFIPRIGTREKTKAEPRAPATAGESALEQPSSTDGHGIKKEAEAGNDILDQSYLYGPYGTQKHTVLLVRQDGTMKYFERTLYDQDTEPVPIGQGDRSFEFQVTQ
ncbi:NRDE protein-domain-containing protein [Aspergillus crustosus]